MHKIKRIYLFISIVFASTINYSCLNNRFDTADNLAVLQPTTTNVFEGSFSGTKNGVVFKIDFKASGINLAGTITINGQTGKVSGSSQGKSCSGTITDDLNAAKYSFHAKIAGEMLTLNLDLIAIAGQLLTVELTKQANNQTQKISKTTNASKLNANIFGLWRHTSVYSSGTGDYHFSISTDYFLDLRADGTYTRWTGRSGGGTQETSIITEADEEEDRTIGTWYCEGKSMYTKPSGANRQVGVLKYYAEGNQMMLTTRYGDKSVYDRIR
jgi:hypothetical protein